MQVFMIRAATYEENDENEITDTSKRMEIMKSRILLSKEHAAEEIYVINKLITMSQRKFYIEGDKFEGLSCIKLRIRLSHEHPIKAKLYRIPH